MSLRATAAVSTATNNDHSQSQTAVRNKDCAQGCKTQIALFCEGSLKDSDGSSLPIIEMIKHSLACSDTYEVTQVDLSRELALLKFCSLPFSAPQSVNWILDYIKLQLQMLYVALSMAFVSGNQRYDFIIVDSISLALPVLRILTPKVFLFQYQDTSAPRIVEDLFLQSGPRFQFYLEKLWRLFCFVTNIIKIICLSIVDKVIVDSYHSQRFLLTLYPYVLTTQKRKQKKIFTFCGIKFRRHFPHVLHPYNWMETNVKPISEHVKTALTQNFNQKILTCMDLNVNTMQELSFVLGAFAKFCLDQRKIHGFHLVLTLRDESLTQIATELIQEYKLTGKVTLLANLNATDRLQLLKQSEMLLYPFQRRSFDHIMVKAMSMGCPVMASNTGAALEIIGQNGMTGFLLPQDPSIWAQKLRDLFTLNAGPQHTISIQDVKVNSKARVRNLFSQIVFTESLHLFMKN